MKKNQNQPIVSFETPNQMLNMATNTFFERRQTN